MGMEHIRRVYRDIKDGRAEFIFQRDGKSQPSRSKKTPRNYGITRWT